MTPYVTLCNPCAARHKATEKILATAERLVAGIGAIAGLRVVGEPVAMVVAMESDGAFNIYQVCAS